MRKSITTLLIFAASISFAQTTIPIKDKAFIERVIGRQVRADGTIIRRHYDYKIEPTIYGVEVDAWANNYRGKWYSNFPYIVKFYYNQHIIKLYKGNTFLCGFTSDGNYKHEWFNKSYFKQNHLSK